MNIVLCKLPKAGLGNQLFPLMKACLFSHLNEFHLVITGYNQIKIGPYLRRDKSKRNYYGYFVFQKGIIQEQLEKLSLLKFSKYEKQYEHFIERLVSDKNNQMYIFCKIPHWSEYFKELKDYRELVIQLFWGILSKNIINEVDGQKAPCIGIHIRRGDYRKLNEGEDFSKVGTVRTPEEYFMDIINKIRGVSGYNLPVSVFTDGHKHELKQLFSLDNIKIVDGNRDIVDLLLLSRSKIIITSAGSTFSSWAGFLSNAPLIMHPDHIYQSIRPSLMGQSIHEGAFDAENVLLIKNIKSISVGNS